MSERKTARRESAKRDAVKRGVRSLSSTWAAVILALLVVVFFHEVVFGGKTFVSPDAVAPAGFARIGEQSLYHDHVYPLWNPYVFLGMPSFASGTYNPLIYPPDWPVAVLQKFLPLPELTWMLIYYFVAAFGMFLLAREWGARAEAALLAGAAFVFAPNLVAVGSHGHGSQLVDSAYLPLMLWLATRWLRRGGLANLAWLALAGGFQLLRGHVQICFYTWIAVVGYAVVYGIAALRDPARRGAAVPRVLGVFVAAGLALGLSAFYNLPLSDYARYSIRGSHEGGGVGVAYATQWSLGPIELPSIVVPGWVGFGGSTYWGSMPFTDYPNVYVGLVTVLLALPAFLANGAKRVFALLLAVLSLLIAFGHNFPLYGFLYDHLPLFNKFRVPVMIVLLFQLAAAAGLAWGWSTWCEESLDAKRARALDRLLVGSAAVFGLVLVAALVARGALEHAYTGMVVARRSLPGQPYPMELAEQAWNGFAGDLVRACALGLAALALAWAVRRRRLSAAVASTGVLVLLLIELWPVSTRVMATALGEPSQRDAELGKDDVVEFLEKAGPPGSFRVIPFQEFKSNRYSGFAIATVGGYHAAKPRIVQDLLERSETNPPMPTWWPLLNVRYVVWPQPIDAPPWLKLAFQGSQVVYENRLALPRATVVGHYTVVHPESAILDSITTARRDPADHTYLAVDPGLRLGNTAGATANVTSYRLNQVVVDVDTPAPALLRLADLWYPDWVARVDGKPTPILRADYLLRAVPVPAGHHRVEFLFESPAMRRGLQLSIASLIAILALFGVARAMRRKGGAAPGTA